MNKIIIKQPWGGLGDNLQFSTIPEMAYRQFGTKCVWVSNHNVYRNSEIKKLVWELNPYIAGFTDEDSSLPEYHINGRLEHIEAVEKGFGLQPCSKYPKIYYDSNEENKHLYFNKVFIDLTSSKDNILSRDFTIKNNINSFLKKMKDENIPINIVVFENIKNTNTFKENRYVDYDMFLKNVSYFNIKNIFEYCDMIKFCRMFVSFSGGQALASAIKCNNDSPEIISFNRKQAYRNKMYIFKNVKYII